MENGVQSVKTHQPADTRENIIFRKIKKLRTQVMGFCVKQIQNFKKYCLITCIFTLIASAFFCIFEGFYSSTSKDWFTAGSGLIAAAAIAYQAHNYLVEKKSETSQFYLEKYIQSLNIILENLTSDKPTRRMAWISAARISVNAKMFEGKITEQTDKVFLEISQNSFLIKLYEFLRKPEFYFCGVDDEIGAHDFFNKEKIQVEENRMKASPGKKPNIPQLTYVDMDSIKKIVDLVKETWRKNDNCSYNNDKEFENIIQFNFSGLGSYFSLLEGFENRMKKPNTSNPNPSVKQPETV